MNRLPKGFTKVIAGRSTKLIAMILAGGVLAAAWTIWGASRAEAVIAIIKQTGNFSLAQGQATSAHVLNIGEDRGIVVNWRVLDTEGNTLARSDPQMVIPGHAATFEYGAGVSIPEGQRVAIHLELRVEGASKNKSGLIATQEVYNVGDG